MNGPSWLLWGFVATIVLTLLMASSQGLGITRMSLPYMLGTIFTTDRDRALVLGSLVHFVNGWLFSLLYVAIFESWHRSGGGLGALLGLAHAAFVLTFGMRLLPPLHPHMASEFAGPTAERQLEPPGFLALNYGVRTPLSVLIAHLIFGFILGSGYVVT